MATTIGGSTVCSGGTAFAGNTLPGFPASNAFNGSTSDFYSSNSGSANTINNYLGYDFGAGNDKDIVDFRLYQYSSFESDMPGWAIVQYSDDDITYTNAWGIHYYGGAFGYTGAENLIASQSGGYKYYKLNFPAPQSGNQIVLQEISIVNAIAIGAGFAWNATAVTADSDNGNYYNEAPAAVDGGQAEWISANAAGAHWWKGYYGPDAPRATQIALRSSFAGSYTSAPASMDVMGSNDDVTYTTIASFSCATWTTNNQVQTFDLPAQVGGHQWFIIG